MDLIAQLNRDQGLTVVLVSHHLRLVRSLVHSVVWVEDGSASKGAPEVILAPERIMEMLRAAARHRVNTLVEIVSPGFLLREALIGSVLVGCLCPLVGVYFVLRRMIFLGVALPQVSAAGIAFAFLMYRMLGWPAPALCAK